MSNSKYFTAAPWYSAEEWKYVFKLIFGPDSNEKCKTEALRILLIWKSRCSDLPSGVESTLGLLEVDLKTPIESDTNISNRLLRLMYSSVIMRFVNHTLDEVSKTRGLTLLQAGPAVNIPQWIVNLRHETAHAHELSSLSLLKNASSFAMNWLFTNYWLPHNDIISNVFTGIDLQDDDFEYDLSQLMYNHNLITVFTYHKFNIKKFHHIPESDIRNGILKFMNDDKYNKSKNKATGSMVIVDALDVLINRIDTLLDQSKRSQNTDIFVKIMLGDESPFMTPDIDCSEENDRKENLSKEYYVIWESFLTYIHKKNMMGTLLCNLLQLVESETETLERRFHAAHWIKQLAIGLNKSKLFKMIPFRHNCAPEELPRECYLRLVHHHPNQKSGLTFDLLHPTPEELKSKDFIHNMFTNVNPFMNIYVKEILTLLDTKLPQESIQNLIDLVNIVSGKKSGNIINENIYSVSDIIMNGSKTSENAVCVDNQKMDVDISSNFNLDINLDKWERASVDYNWGQIPIGILPWQMKQIPVNPTLTFEI